MGLFGEKTSSNNVIQNSNQNQVPMSPIAQAEQNCQNAKRELEGAYLSLGKLFFEKTMDNAASEFVEQISEIKEKKEKETLWNQYRLSLDGRTICEHCGSIITSDSVFCNKCGGKIAPRDFTAIGIGTNQYPASPSQNLCPTCGSLLVEGAAFCEKCGMKVQ